MTLSPKDILAAGRLMAREKAPYFGAALLGLVPREAPGLGTVGVTDRGIMLWDPEAVGQWTVPQMAGALIHEVGHILRKHHERFIGRDHARANQAMDLAQNDDIIAMGFELPPNGLYPKNMGFKPNLSAEEYYTLLEKKDAPKQEKPSCGGGWCGSCAQRPVPGEPDEKGKDPAERSEADMQRMAKQCAEEIRKASTSKQAGTIPGSWQRWADDFLKPAKVRWQDKLSRTVRQGVTYAAGAVDHTYNRPSRRQGGIGFGPGRPLMPAFWAPQPIVDVVVDTSGSMGSQELGIAVRETNGILRTTGSKVRFCVCDAQVHGLTQIKTWREAAALLKGGGGTAFQPAFDAIAAQRDRPHVIVFVTDGYNYDPDGLNPPKGAKVIWLLVGPMRQRPAPFGDVIEVDD